MLATCSRLIMGVALSLHRMFQIIRDLTRGHVSTYAVLIGHRGFRKQQQQQEEEEE